MSASDLSVSANQVSRVFGSFVAVADATFTVPRGGVTALVGPNGSGKTTLMLVLAGLLTPPLELSRCAGLTRSPITSRYGPGWDGCRTSLGCGIR